MKQHIYIFHAVFLIIFIFGCRTEEVTVSSLSIVEPNESNIIFVNNLRESPNQNFLDYEYYYNGAGVAIADFNGDGLPDIYFISNLESNALYLNLGDMKFREITKISKAEGKIGFSTGVSTVDINNDGRWDLYICNSGRFDNPDRRRNELLVNMGNDNNGVPIFQEMAADYGLDIESYSSQATFFDYDKDGDLDMFLINHGIDSYDVVDIPILQNQPSTLSGELLFRNDDNYFKDVTESAGIVNNKLSFGLGVAISDLNNDGYPDIYVSHDYSGKDHLYLNRQDGTFQEKITDVTNQISFYAMGNDVGDINNDGWTDIVNLDMVAADSYGVKTSMSAMNTEQFYNLINQGEHYQYMFNSLLLNSGAADNSQDVYFSNIGQLAGISNTDWSWAPLLMDLDNDGWQDLFISNGIKRNIRNNDALRQARPLLEKRKNTTDKTEKVLLTQQILQTFPYHPRPNYFFSNNKNLTFSNVSAEFGLDSLYSMSNGASYADLDLDGDLDIVVSNADQPAFIYQNHADVTESNHSLSITFKGPESNVLGIGTKVEIYSNEGVQTKELYPSRGYLSSVEPKLHFGTGPNTSVSRLKVEWPDGNTQVLENIDVGTLTIAYKDSKRQRDYKVEGKTLFSLKKNTPIVDHIENPYDDFTHESLLPHKMSNLGPGAIVGDVNGDGIDDLYVGGAKGQSAKLLLGNTDGGFEAKTPSGFLKDRENEDVAAYLLDVDSDGDLDLIVGNGSNEWDPSDEIYNLRYYENNGQGTFKKRHSVLPGLKVSTGVIIAQDWDNDGDDDLFIGGRQLPGKYPQPANSYILMNESDEGKPLFVDATEALAPYLLNYGMVTDAISIDIDDDGNQDIITVGEWMSPKILANRINHFEDVTDSSGLAEELGWWYCVEVADFDQDGDLDIVAGNLGLNYKYKASKESPFQVYANDFDSNGSLDIVLSYEEGDSQVPLRGRECSSNQMPFIKKKYKTYDAYASATIEDIFDPSQLNASTHYKASNFAHCYFENRGNFEYSKKELPVESQVSSINAIVIEDFDHDGNLDVLCAGNLYGSEVETPRNDASFGHLMRGNGKGDFEVIPLTEHGFRTKGEVRHMALISTEEKDGNLIVVKNNMPIEQFEIRTNEQND